MIDLEKIVEARMRHRPSMSHGKRFGITCWSRGSKPYLLVAPNLIVLRGLSENRKDEACRKYGGSCFVYREREKPDWTQIPIKVQHQLDALEHLVEEAYRAGW